METRTQSKYSNNRKTGGLRTYRKCSVCNISTRGIWKINGEMFCYKCYKKRLNQLNSEKKMSREIEYKFLKEEDYINLLLTFWKHDNFDDEYGNSHFKEHIDNYNSIDEMDTLFINLINYVLNQQKLKENYRIKRRDAEILEMIGKICLDSQMYADMNEDDFWKTSTISPKEAQLRANYQFELFEQLKQAITNKQEVQDG